MVIIKYKIITLCGSTKFKKQFEMINAKLTLDGNVVMSLGVYGHADNIELTNKEKVHLKKIHFQKIDMSDELFIINVDGYIGAGTRDEIEYAKLKNIPIKYLQTIL